MGLKSALLVATILTPAPAFAQAWDVGAQTVTYPSNCCSFPFPREVQGDGSTTQGGTMPLTSIEPADIATDVATTGWVANTAISYGDFGEAKLRINCNISHLRRDDPILYPGQVGRSHLHQFFGNTSADANSTYTSLRTNPNGVYSAGKSTCGGGPFNRTAYWAPVPIDTNGKAVIADFVTIYYTDDLANTQYLSRIPRGFKYIMGMKMGDPDDLAVKAEVTAANVGGNRGYSYGGNGQAGWSCVGVDGSTYNGSNADSPNAGASLQPYLKAENGNATLTCNTGTQIAYDLDAPRCIDGKNLQSPTGYGHLRYGISDQAGRTNDICPEGWFRIPGLQLKFVFTHTGSADYKEWRLSSDDMAGIARNGSASSMHNGESFHADWFGAWDYGTEASPGIMLKWLRFCSGVVFNGVSTTGTTCNYSTITDTERLITDSAAPDGTRNPQVDLTTPATRLDQPPLTTGSGRIRLRVTMTEPPADENATVSDFDLAALDGSRTVSRAAPGAP